MQDISQWHVLGEGSPVALAESFLRAEKRRIEGAK